jgi:hypothetical protein
MARSLTTIVEDYAAAALRRAQIEEQGNGVLGAYLPQIPGLVALGNDRHELALSLYRQVQEAVRIRLESGQRLPIIDGIDLNTEAEKVLASYRPAAEGRRFKAVSDGEFETMLEREDSQLP